MCKKTPFFVEKYKYDVCVERAEQYPMWKDVSLNAEWGIWSQFTLRAGPIHIFPRKVNICSLYIIHLLRGEDHQILFRLDRYNAS